ncbi:efflux transporter outer membrane subunit [Pseudomonas gingeri]|uniref:efflux transporter outer membrane subunit n=1 Tax=Pseudomonas gingeri TaxID=117681 RepID=UPI0015A28B42|nr:efflux transporter outer membrane subunit [Pseudomonas gingeri]NVZ24688.1 efflux transporter outer membrane subunit [Pseudomonas gingeri]
MSLKTDRKLSVCVRLPLVGAMLLGGCAAGPDFQPPQTPATATYLATQPRRIGTQTLHDTRAVGWGWWRPFGSVELNDSVEHALQGNLDIQAARAHLERAAYITQSVAGRAKPQVDTNAGIGRTRIGAAELGPDYRQTPTFSAYSAGLAATFDLDFFGAIKRTVEQHQAQEILASNELDAVMLNVSAQVVYQSIRAASATSRLRIINTLLEIERDRLTLMQQAMLSGVATQDELDRQSRLIADTAGQVPLLQQERAQAQNALAVLSGALPAPEHSNELALEDLVLPADLPLTLPSALASQRPDILAAQAHLHAASASVGIATANRYPHIELRAALSEQGVFSGPAGLAWNAIGGLTAPLFDGGSLHAAQYAAKADYAAAQADYQQVVIKAFGQVADSLQALTHDVALSEASDTALTSAATSLARTEKAYSAGGASQLQRLDAQREWQSRCYQNVGVRAQQLADSAVLIVSTAGSITQAPLPKTHQPR